LEGLKNSSPGAINRGNAIILMNNNWQKLIGLNQKKVRENGLIERK
jgi:hypothetical protein